jgi:hypothetical protein
MTTGNQLIDDISAELNRDDLASGGSNAAVSQRALNNTLRDILNRYAFSWRVSQSPLAVACIVSPSPVSVYDLSAAPTNTKIQDIEEIVLDTGRSDTDTMDERSVRIFLSKWANLDYLGTSTPYEYCRLDKYTIKIAPLPSQAYTMRIYYSPEFTDITVFTGDITQVLPRMMECVTVGMLARLYRWLHEFERYGAILPVYEDLIQKAIKEDKEAPNLTFKLGSGSPHRTSSVEYWRSPFSDTNP